MSKTETAQVFLMTDKPKTKDCPCTYAGCINVCRVNMFYAPAKAKCPEHGGQAMTRQDDGDFVELEVTKAETVEIEVLPNHRLRHLMCPICEAEEPMEILACTEGGHIDFGCQECYMIVGLSFNWKPLQLRSIPDLLKPLVKTFNIKQVGTMDLQVARELTKFGK